MLVYMRIVILAAAWLLLAGAWARAEDPARGRLEESSRHQEWTTLEVGGRKVKLFVVFPEVAKPATAVIVVHENKGLTDWVKGAADQIAELGYVALAPDLLSGAGPDGGATDAFASQADATQAIYDLPPDQVTADLQAVFQYARGLDACNGKVAAAGFCWGGGQTFRFATNQPELTAALVFYGSAPTDKAELARITCPVYGYYGGNDARINTGISQTKVLMKELSKTYEPVIYEGAGHGFMRAGEAADADVANRDGRAAGWERVAAVLGKL